QFHVLRLDYCDSYGNVKQSVLTGYNRKENGVTVMLVAITTEFLLFNLLAFANNVLELTGAYGHSQLETLLVEVSALLVNINGASTIVIYLIFGSKYRAIFIQGRSHKYFLEKMKLELYKKAYFVVLITNRDVFLVSPLATIKWLKSSSDSEVPCRRHGNTLERDYRRCRTTESVTTPSQTGYSMAEQMRYKIAVKLSANDQFCRRSDKFGTLTKGFFHITGCRFKGNQSTKIGIDIAVTSLCGVRRRRLANPRGLALDTTIVVMFHPIFMTQVDKAYHLQCHYLETSSNVTGALEVITPSATELPLSIAVMDEKKTPTCKYEVLNKDRNGSPVQFASLGATVYHKWTCESEDMKQYCMTVHSCTANDGHGIGQRLIDEKGCSLDQYLLDNLEYGADLTAGKEASMNDYEQYDTEDVIVEKDVKEEHLNVRNSRDAVRRSHDVDVSSSSIEVLELPDIGNVISKIPYAHNRILKIYLAKELEVINRDNIKVPHSEMEKRSCLEDTDPTNSDIQQIWADRLVDVQSKADINTIWLTEGLSSKWDSEK
ncbi:unnamed protein product, partial [Angiostrongylus costaricensis]|uniref:ZP domain-containing protein n=1 Tax=Angiostrongylus costaricensis TaxID=334426 RepID=A0A158PKW5_ANGCS